MKIITKEINEEGTNYLIYVSDLINNPLVCEYATTETKTNVINNLRNQFGNIEIVEEMNYNEYINQ